MPQNKFVAYLKLDHDAIYVFDLMPAQATGKQLHETQNCLSYAMKRTYLQHYLCAFLQESGQWVWVAPPAAPPQLPTFVKHDANMFSLNRAREHAAEGDCRQGKEETLRTKSHQNGFQQAAKGDFLHRSRSTTTRVRTHHHSVWSPLRPE